MAEFLSSDGVRLHYDDDGTGPVVLCLAGLTRNSTDFTYALPALTGHRVLRMDYRGRGKSDYPDDFMSYNILREGQDAIELLDHLGVERAVILSTSRGGLIAMALSVTNQRRLSGVIMNDIGPEVTETGITRFMDYVGKEPPFANLEAAAEALQSGHAHDFPGVPLARWREQAEFMWSEKPGGGVALRYDPRLRDALIGQAGVGKAPDLWQLFDGLRDLPLAVIRGENSDLFAAETLSRMQSRHPGMITAVVPDRGHVPFLDEPEAVAAIQTLLEQAK